MTASDEAKARMETKAEVEMAYMVKQVFLLMVYDPVEGSSILYSCEARVVRTDGG